mgnify:CR=1 FL=1
MLGACHIPSETGRVRLRSLKPGGDLTDVATESLAQRRPRPLESLTRGSRAVARAALACQQCPLPRKN